MEPFSLHVEAMAWLRFGKRMSFVCSEVGPFNADVMGADDKQLIEVEVKKSRADFRKDFDKVRKHSYYKNPPPGRALWVPNRFYYIVHSKLKDAGLEILAEHESPAGLLVVNRPISGVYIGAGRRVTVWKQAKQIHDRVPSPGIIKDIGRRMSSELTTLRLRLEDLRNHEGPLPVQGLSAILHAQRLALRELGHTPDWEIENDVSTKSNSPITPADGEANETNL